MNFDHVLGPNESLWIRTPEGVVHVGTFTGTSVLVYINEDGPLSQVFLSREQSDQSAAPDLED